MMRVSNSVEAEPLRDRLRARRSPGGSRCRARRRRGARTRTSIDGARRLRSRSPCPSGRDATSSRSRCRASRRARASVMPARPTNAPVARLLDAPIARCRAAPTGRATPPSARPRLLAADVVGEVQRAHAPPALCSTSVYASRSLSRNGRRISRSVSSVGHGTLRRQPPATAGTMLTRLCRRRPACRCPAGSGCPRRRRTR